MTERDNDWGRDSEDGYKTFEAFVTFMLIFDLLEFWWIKTDVWKMTGQSALNVQI